MTSIASSSAATTAGAAATPAPDSSGATSGDLLAGMRPAMDAAFAVGRPSDASGAATILGTGSSYLQGAGATLRKLDEGIAKRSKEIEQLRQIDPDGAQDAQSQLDMLQRLRDRIQLSIERVSDILAGTERDDIGGPEGAAGGSNDAQGSREDRRREELALLERRRNLLAPSGADAVAPSANPAVVAGAYSSATVHTTS